MSDPTAESDQRPVLRIVRGEPTPDELAALLVAVLGTSAPAAEPEPIAPSAWTTYHRGRSHDLRPGPDAWRRSLR